MSRFSAYLRNAVFILEKYEGSEPFAVFLKKYFGENKKFGSTDRKQITSLCYRYFRLGNWAKNLDVQMRLLIAEFMMGGADSPFIKESGFQFAYEQENEILRIDSSITVSLKQELHTEWCNYLQQEVAVHDYVHSMLNQPDLFLRIRPGMNYIVADKLHKAEIQFEYVRDDTIRLPISSRVSEVLLLNKEAVIQDLNSQKCGHIIKQFIPDIRGPLWDVCAASGGKSLLLRDLYGGIHDLTVTDVRPSILKNLSVRFKKAGIQKYRGEIADLTKTLPKNFFRKPLKVIMVDAPCTGSGTWARTPEQHSFFDPKSIADFQARQLEICKNSIIHLEEGGYLIYITCSVFKMENVDVVQGLIKSFPLNLIHQQVLDGTKKKADSMFIAIMQKK